jgi:hypothetical protein
MEVKLLGEGLQNMESGNAAAFLLRRLEVKTLISGFQLYQDVLGAI